MSPVTQDIATVGHTASQFAKYLTEGHDLCRQIATLDLAGYPLYIIPQSRIVDFFGKAEACYAYTAPNLDLYLKKYIDTWHGRGPCMVINDLAIAEDYDACFHEELVRNHIVHELAHVLDRPQPVPQKFLSADRVTFESLIVASVTNTEPSTAPIYGHALSFIRIAVHLIERANREGQDIRHAGVCRMRDYGLSPIEDYVKAIGFEVEENIYVRVRDFPPPPIRLLELFQSDTQPRGGSA